MPANSIPSMIFTPSMISVSPRPEALNRPANLVSSVLRFPSEIVLFGTWSSFGGVLRAGAVRALSQAFGRGATLATGFACGAPSAFDGLSLMAGARGQCSGLESTGCRSFPLGLRSEG